MVWIMIALGGGIGALLRYTVISLSTKVGKPAYYATAIVNLLGSFLLGVVLQSPFAELYISFLAIGVLGAFTTFSTFAFDFVHLFNERQFRKSICYLAINLVGGLLLFTIGFYI